MHKIKVEHSFPLLRNVFIGFLCLLMLIIGISVADYYHSNPANKQQGTISYTQFLEQVNEQKVERVTIEHNKIIGKLKDGVVVSTDIPISSDFIETLKKNNVDYQF